MKNLRGGDGVGPLKAEGSELESDFFPFEFMYIKQSVESENE